MASTKGRKGKVGKNKTRIKVYYGNGRNLWNKARKIVHHLRKYKDDTTAQKALRELGAAMQLGMQRDFEEMYDVGRN